MKIKTKCVFLIAYLNNHIVKLWIDAIKKEIKCFLKMLLDKNYN